jgi:hypothetical protein
MGGGSSGVAGKAMNFKIGTLVLAVVAGLSFFVGYKLAPREILDSEVKHVGILVFDTKKVLSATIESLKSESRLVSYSYVGNQNVAISRSYWRLFNGNQQLIVPATVSYFVELAELTESSVTYNDVTNTVTITAPRLLLSVDFDPRRATTVNSGLMTFSDSEVQALTKLNYDTARKSAVKQGQQSELVRLARERSKENIKRLFEIPLRVAGNTEVKILVKFPGETAQ